MEAGQILAIDQGTHATRAFIFDRLGSIVASAQQRIELHRYARNEVEQDARQILASMQSVIADVLDSPGVHPAQIDVAGLATQRSSVVAWNRLDGAPLSPVLSWQDRRNESLIATLKSEDVVVQEKTGLRLSAHYGASKLRWLLEREPAVARAQAAGELLMGPLASWLIYHLLVGNPTLVDHANASRTLLWNLHTRDWDSDLLRIFEVSITALPSCRSILSDYGVTLTGGIPLRAVNGDQTAALYAQGRPEPGTIIVNLGTGAFVLLPVADISVRPDGLLAGVSQSQGPIVDCYLEGTVNGAGAALDWVADRFAISNMEQQIAVWLRDIEEAPLFINTVGGLGSPWWQAGPAPYFLSEPPSPAHAIVAVLESILFLVQVNVTLLQTHEPDIQRIQLSGGLARLDGLCQKLADLSGLSVLRSPQIEATARGIAWQAAGCPLDWPASGRTDLFLPQANKGLQRRYRQFTAVLKQVRISFWANTLSYSGLAAVVVLENIESIENWLAHMHTVNSL
jgi:glycerol kinase